MLKPIKSLDGTITLPGSKSLSNRILLLSAFSDGNTEVDNLLDSDDIQYMLKALKQLEVPLDIKTNEDGSVGRVTVTGQAGPIDSPTPEDVQNLFLGNAGKLL